MTNIESPMAASAATNNAEHSVRHAIREHYLGSVVTAAANGDCSFRIANLEQVTDGVYRYTVDEHYGSRDKTRTGIVRRDDGSWTVTEDH